MTFDDFREKYPLREPNRERINNQDEMIELTAAEGVLSFSATAGQFAQLSALPTSHESRGTVYLWVISSKDLPFAPESLFAGKHLISGVIKHTNLTGGQPAHSGGELWFIDSKRLLIGGQSGRYGARSGQELLDAALSFKNLDYTVASLGYDTETGKSFTVLIGEPKWL